MKKIIIVLCMFFLLGNVFADSFSLNTVITGVSNGVNGIGMGMFPVGTKFVYEKRFHMLDNYRHSALFHIEQNFSFGNARIPSDYAWDTGKPRWDMTKAEQIPYDNEGRFKGGEFFFPKSYLDIFLQQGFGTDPVSQDGSLVDVRIGINIQYSMALENVNRSYNQDSGFLFFNPESNGYIKPFGPGSVLPAYPWLQDNRKNLTNYLFLRTYWNFTADTAKDAYDGAYAKIEFEYGPSWLGNTITPSGVSSDYFKVYASLEEKLTLFAVKQDDGKNWANAYIGHSNSVGYTGGSVVPEHKIPDDRLRAYVTDRIWVRFTGPQFIANDCYTYIELSLNNGFYFGHVVNEPSQSTTAIEFKSSLSGTFHLRLFGFIRFEYNLGYNFIKGFWAQNPNWWQRADLAFYVSI